MEQAVDILNLASQLIGLTESITINSQIYDHLFELPDNINVHQDIHVISGSMNNPICFTDILTVFNAIQQQFDTLELNGLDDRSYYYEGLSYDPQTRTIFISWGS